VNGLAVRLAINAAAAGARSSRGAMNVSRRAARFAFIAWCVVRVCSGAAFFVLDCPFRTQHILPVRRPRLPLNIWRQRAGLFRREQRLPLVAATWRFRLPISWW